MSNNATDPYRWKAGGMSEVLQMAVSSLDTISALLGFSALTESSGVRSCVEQPPLSSTHLPTHVLREPTPNQREPPYASHQKSPHRDPKCHHRNTNHNAKQCAQCAHHQPSPAYLHPSPLHPSTHPRREYTLQEVEEHCWDDDCWVVIYDRVYDVTHFLRRHPGGQEILMESAGRDASNAFYGVGHSQTALDMMAQYQVGVLAAHQCMWRGKGR